MSKRLTSLITLIAGLLLVAGIAVAQVGGSDESTATSTSTTLEDNGGDRPDGVSDDTPGDISGPCDEAEHADDLRCGGSGTQVDDGADDISDDSPGDVSGPCDEAEHANDPRCTGVVGSDDESHDSDDDDTIENHSDDSDDDDSDDDSSDDHDSDDDEDESDDD